MPIHVSIVCIALLLQWLSGIVVTEMTGPEKLKKIFTPWFLKLGARPHSIALQREGDELQSFQRRVGDHCCAFSGLMPLGCSPFFWHQPNSHLSSRFVS